MIFPRLLLVLSSFTVPGLTQGVKPPIGGPSSTISGVWDVEIVTLADSESRIVIFKQIGQNITGTTVGCVGEGGIGEGGIGEGEAIKINGTIKGTHVEFRYTDTCELGEGPPGRLVFRGTLKSSLKIEGIINGDVFLTFSAIKKVMPSRDLVPQSGRRR